MDKQEYIQLRDLLIKYRDEVGLNDEDVVDYFIDEIEKNKLNLKHNQLFTTKRWWKGLTQKEKDEIIAADGKGIEE